MKKYSKEELKAMREAVLKSEKGVKMANELLKNNNLTFDEITVLVYNSINK